MLGIGVPGVDRIDGEERANVEVTYILEVPRGAGIAGDAGLCVAPLVLRRARSLGDGLSAPEAGLEDTSVEGIAVEGRAADRVRADPARAGRPRGAQLSGAVG